MRFLLDTHTLIWWWDESPKLSRPALDALSDGGSLVYVSAITGWEIAHKVRFGKLPTMARWIDDFGAAIIGEGFSHLTITHRHSVSAGLLSGEHRDPFDRLIAAQALIEDLTVVTRDREIAGLGCKVLW